MMEDSYFLHTKRSSKKLEFKYFGCCETAGSYFTDSTSINELISLKEINDPFLSNPAVIEEYLTLISEFLDIPIKRIDNPPIESIESRSGIINASNEKEWNENYVCFNIGKYLSNKHFVAMHNLIRYLWYGQHGYHSIVNAIINLRRISPTLAIEDVFAIAHSFQERTNRALTGKNHAKNLGFMYFKKKSEYLKDLKKDYYFNSVFDSFEISLIPSVSIRGNFFEESEITLSIKHFISFLTDLDNASPLISKKLFNEVLKTYEEYRPFYLEVCKIVNDPAATKKCRILKCDIFTNDSTLDRIEFEAGNSITGRNSKHTLKNLDELIKVLNEPDKK